MIDERAFLLAIAARLAALVVALLLVVVAVVLLAGCGDDCPPAPADAGVDAGCCLAGCPAPAPECCTGAGDPRPVCEP